MSEKKEVKMIKTVRKKSVRDTSGFSKRKKAELKVHRMSLREKPGTLVKQSNLKANRTSLREKTDTLSKKSDLVKVMSLREKCETLLKDSKKIGTSLNLKSGLHGGTSAAILENVKIEGRTENTTSYYIDINGNYMCHVCSTVHKSLKKFKLHEALHHSEETQIKDISSVFKCSVCPKEFQCMLELRRHKYQHRLQQKRENDMLNLPRFIICPICEKTFDTESEFDKHRKEHLPSKMFLCKLCGFKFKTQLQFSIHKDLCYGKIKNDTTKSIDPKRHLLNYTCKFCGSQFSNLLKLKSHTEEFSPNCKFNRNLFSPKICHVLIQYECRNCKFQFKNQEQLKLHNEVCSSKSLGNYGGNRKFNNRYPIPLSSEKDNLDLKKNEELTKQLTEFCNSSSDDSGDDSSQSDCSTNYSDVTRKEGKTKLNDQMITDDDVTMHCENQDEIHMTSTCGGNMKSVSDLKNSESEKSHLFSNNTFKIELALTKLNENELISKGTMVAVDTYDNEMYIRTNTFPEYVKNKFENPTLSDISQVKVKQEEDDSNFEMECGICGQFFQSYKSLKSHFDQHSLQEVDDESMKYQTKL